jgi:hypothetical protein
MVVSALSRQERFVAGWSSYVLLINHDLKVEGTTR